MERRKVVHQLDTPFSSAPWPHISQEDQDTILELLCSLLSPLGQHRTSFITPSKGKRDRRRKRKDGGGSTAPPSVPPAPEIGRYLDVGLSKISKTLEELSSGDRESGRDAETLEGPCPMPYAVIFVPRSGQSSAFHSHFPQMVVAASQSLLAGQAIRLVGFSKACEARLSSCLGIPRVSSIALREGARGSEGLVDFVREHVAAVEVPWLQEAQKARFLPTKINTYETTVGTKRQKPS